MESLKKTKTSELPCDPAIPLLGMYTWRNSNSKTRVHAHRSGATTAETRQQPSVQVNG